MADKPAIVRYDTKDDRREIHLLLARLPPRRRVAFVRWCCKRARLGGYPTFPGVSRRTEELADLAMRDDSADRKLALDCFMDLLHLERSYQFDLDAALLKLVDVVRREIR